MAETVEYKFGVNNRVWFVPDYNWDSSKETPSFLFGEIAERYTKEVDGKLRKCYEIWPDPIYDDGVYQVDENWTFDTLKELMDAVLNSILEDLKEIGKQIEFLRKEERNTKQHLKYWRKECKENQDNV